MNYIKKAESLRMIVRNAAEIEFDEGNPKEIFDRIGLRPHINAELVEIRREYQERKSQSQN